MYRNCARVLRTTPLTKKSLTQQQQPSRTFILHRGRSPWNHFEDTVRTMERQFDRMENDMNSILRNVGLGHYRGRGLLRTPIESEIVSEGSPSKYSLNIDLGAFYSKPENIKVTLKDRQLTVLAKLEAENETSRIYQEVSRKFTLPENIDPKEMTSVLTPEGTLTIEAPLLSQQTATETLATTTKKATNTQIPITRHEVGEEQ